MENKLYLIDVEAKGNVIKFYFSNEKDKIEARRDDWNDSPPYCNAGIVYDKYVKLEKVFAINWSYNVEVPMEEDEWNYRYRDFCKADYKMDFAPCLIITEDNEDFTNKCCGVFRMGDTLNEVYNKINSLNGAEILKNEK